MTLPPCPCPGKNAWGEEKENLTAQALELSLKYHFVTPLTSMVVTKPEDNENQTAIANKPGEGRHRRWGPQPRCLMPRPTTVAALKRSAPAEKGRSRRHQEENWPRTEEGIIEEAISVNSGMQA